MTIVIFDKVSAGPGFGPYNAGDVVDLNAGDVAAHTAPAVAAVHTPTAKELAQGIGTKPTKKGT